MRIALSTSGGDAPGLNAVIRAATTAALRHGHEIFGIRNGFEGLVRNDDLLPLTLVNTAGIERIGGTILGAASSGQPFDAKANGLDQFVAALKRHRIDALIMAGGDGTMAIAHTIYQAGVRVVGVPKTIDRDLQGTWTTFGFDTAVNTATEAVDKLHTTVSSHHRLMVIEVMGRDTGWIALYAGIGGGAHMIAIPEIPYDVHVFAEHIQRREAQGLDYHILVASEGAHPANREASVDERTGRYGGIGERLAKELSDLTGKESRSISLGHLLRGGPPTVFDRVLGLRFGSAAVSALEMGESGVMISFQPPAMTSVPLIDVAGKINPVTAQAHEIRTAQNLGISFGV